MSYNAEQDSSDICYTYDGTFDGLLTAIFTAVYSRKTPLHILPADRLQLAFGERYINIVTEAEKAGARYERGDGQARFVRGKAAFIMFF